MKREQISHPLLSWLECARYIRLICLVLRSPICPAKNFSNICQRLLDRYPVLPYIEFIESSLSLSADAQRSLRFCFAKGESLVDVAPGAQCRSRRTLKTVPRSSGVPNRRGRGAASIGLWFFKESDARPMQYQSQSYSINSSQIQPIGVSPCAWVVTAGQRNSTLGMGETQRTLTTGHPASESGRGQHGFQGCTRPRARIVESWYYEPLSGRRCAKSVQVDGWEV